jgi:GTPase Era involved in 16S rRNA processing
MMAFVRGSLEDADVILMMTDVFEDPGDFPDENIFEQMRNCKRLVGPVIAMGALW